MDGLRLWSSQKPGNVSRGRSRRGVVRLGGAKQKLGVVLQWRGDSMCCPVKQEPC